MQFRDLKSQYGALKPEIDLAIQEVLDNCNYINGNQVLELERILAEYVGVKHCITCGNGTDALSMVLKAWGIGRGDAVFVPDFTFFASAEVVAFEGATPVFYDVKATTFNASPRSLKRAIECIVEEGKLNPRAIIAVDLFGQPADYIALSQIADEYNLLLLEDGAQGFGGKIGEKRACSFGNAATTSFFPAKPLGCYGDGGAIFTDDDKVADFLNSFKVHGKGDFKYDNVRIGWNSRLDTLQAAVLKVKFDAFCSYELEEVNRVASIYDEKLQGIVDIPVVEKDFYSSWAQYTIRLKTKEQRDTLQKHLSMRGIPSMVYYPKAMSAQKAFKNVKQYEICETAAKLCDTVLSLPIHPYLRETDIQEISTEVKKSLQ